MDTYPFIMKRNILCLIPGKGDFWIKFVVFLVYVQTMGINPKPQICPFSVLQNDKGNH